MRLDVGEAVEHAERPAEQHDLRHAQGVQKLGDVLAPAAGGVAVGRHLGIALAARIKGDDAAETVEIGDLRSEDPGGHGPARNEDQHMVGRVTPGGLGIDVVEIDAVTRGEIAAGGDEARIVVREGGHRREGADRAEKGPAADHWPTTARAMRWKSSAGSVPPDVALDIGLSSSLPIQPPMTRPSPPPMNHASRLSCVVPVLPATK